MTENKLKMENSSLLKHSELSINQIIKFILEKEDDIAEYKSLIQRIGYTFASIKY